MSLLIWPSDLPDALSELADSVAADLEPMVVADLPEPGGTDDGEDIVVLIIAGTEQADAGLAWLESVGGSSGYRVIAVVTDGYLGSDASAPNAAESAAAVGIIRSLAVRRGTSVRANAISIPEGLVGPTGELQGPLPDEVEVSDIAAAIDFLAGADGLYLSGQVLFVDSGRQLFTSHTS